MIWLQPAALGFLALIPIVVLFYILRAQHQQRLVPSVRFWRQIPSDLEGRPAWRVPLANLLLLLQILTILLLVAALVRPALVGGTRRNLIAIVDASASMQATDVQPSRFDEARRQAADLVGALAYGDEFSVILAGRDAVVLGSGTGGSRDAALRALSAATPTGGATDLVGALALAASLAEKHGDSRNEIVVLSDGVFPPLDLGKLGPIRADVRLALIGQSDRNVAIDELSVRPMLGNAGRYLGYLRAVNYSAQEQTVPLLVLADGLKVESSQLRLPPNGQADLTLAVPTGARLLEAQLGAGDYLRLDDQAFAPVGTDRPIDVVLVTANSLFWERVLQAIPLLKVTKVLPSDYRGQPAEVTILDGIATPGWPSGNALFVNPPTGGVLEVQGDGGAAGVSHVDRQSPLLDSVDLESVVLAHTVRVPLPAWAGPVAESDSAALIFSGVHDGRRLAVFAFDPAQSDLPQRIAFPILIANTLSWLSPAGLPARLAPGDIMDIPPLPEARQVIVRMPGGRTVVYPNDGRPVRFSQTAAVGAYVVTQWSGSAALAAHTFVVNVMDKEQSDIRPRADAIGAPLANAASAGPAVQQEIWPYLAALALAALTGEWWYYGRQKT